MSNTPSTDLLNIEHLRVQFKHAFEAVKDVSFSIPPHHTTALVGESGSGKSVTALSILRLLPKTAHIHAQRMQYGAVDLLQLESKQLRTLRGKAISMIFQDPSNALNPVFTVGEQIAESLRLHLKLTARQARTRAVELLDEVGIPQPQLRVHSYAHELSGGQQQRVMIAMAIACEPKLLIADEPTTALDVTVQQQILQLLTRLRAQRGMSMLFITHDLSLVSEIADTALVMQNGVIVEQGPCTQVFSAPQHAYTQALLACRPKLNWRPKRLPVIETVMRTGLPADIPTHVRSVAVDTPIILEARNLSKTFHLKKTLFRSDALHAVQHVSFKLPRGKTLGIVGESGSGKTTTAWMLLGLLAASDGQVLLEGKDLLTLNERELRPVRRRMQMVFQNPYASLNPRFTVAHLLLEPMQIHHIGTNTAKRLQRAQQLLQRVGLPNTALHRYPHEFSGGQRQRIAIARALSVQPDILICDEAVSALDVSVQAQVLNLLQDLQDELGLSYIFISHDLPVVQYISDLVLVMHQGQVVELAAADQLYRAPQAEYTRKLLRAIPGSNAPAFIK